MCDAIIVAAQVRAKARHTLADMPRWHCLPIQLPHALTGQHQAAGDPDNLPRQVDYLLLANAQPRRKSI